MAQFSICGGCSRHVRASDKACPFCGQSVADSAPARTLGPRLPRRAGRAALWLLGAATTAVAPTACGSDSDETSNTQDSQNQDDMQQAVYGAPVDPEPDAGATDDAGAEDNADSGGEPIAQPVYGAPVAVYGAPVDGEQ